MKICSFNVLNFRLGTDSQGERFKRAKIEKIGTILQRNHFDIIALQEIKDGNTVEELAKGLGYCWCHCQDLYRELNEESFLNRRNSNFKAEYAFLWNPRSIVLDTAPEIYKGISEHISKELDLFITGAVTVVLGLLKLEQKKDEDDRGQPRNGNRHLKKILASLGIVGTGVGIWALKEAALRKMIENTLHQSLRPPLIGIFRKSDSHENKELRLINIHTQWTKHKRYESESARQIRRLELSFVLGPLFDIVASQRDGTGRTPITMIAGDYNFTLPEVMPIHQDVSVQKRHRNRDITSTQGQQTTLVITNPEEVEQGKSARYEFRNDYDHFSFDKLAFTRNEPIAQRVPWSRDDFFIDEKLISDHAPVQIEFMF